MKALQELGLSYYESKVVEVVLHSDKVSMQALCRKAGIPAGKVYTIVRALQEKGLVKVTDVRPKEVFVSNASEVLGKLIDKHQQRQECILSKLRAVAAACDIAKAQSSRFFELGTTLEDNKAIQLRSFREARREVCQILNVHHKPQSNRASKTVWEKEIIDAVKRGVVFRSLYPVSCELPPLLHALYKKHPDKFQVRRLDTSFVRCDVIDAKKVLVKLVYEDATRYGGVIFLENERFAQNLQSIFDEFWERAQEYN